MEWCGKKATFWIRFRNWMADLLRVSSRSPTFLMTEPEQLHSGQGRSGLFDHPSGFFEKKRLAPPDDVKEKPA